MKTSMIPGSGNDFGIVRFFTKILSLIKYNWDTFTEPDGTRKLRDAGVAPKYHANLLAGQGMSLDESQDVVIPVNDTIETEYVFKDGVATYTEGTQVLADYTIDGVAVYQTIILYKGIFTQVEKDALKNNPEEFLYKDSGVLKSNILPQEKIDDVVSYIPCCDTDSNVTDLVSGTRYPINNFTQLVRDNADNLPTGLQTYRLIRDANGVPTGLSPYMENDGVGYADTGYIAPTDSDFTIRCIIDCDPKGVFQQMGSGNAFNEKLQFGLWSTNQPFLQGRDGTDFKDTAITVKTPIYFTIIKRGVNNELYIGKTLKLTTTDSGLQSGDSFFIGARNATGTPSFNILSQVRLFETDDKALTQEELDTEIDKAVAQGLLS